MFIKGVGGKLSSKILEMRRSGFTSVEDFISKTKTGDRELSALMAVSAFNSIGYNGFSQKERKDNWEKYLNFIPSEPETILEL
jgi:DNA polymerase III alpha subunit